MVKPLEILSKILNLEAQDYNYQDKAVSGGLARYADTWHKQAAKALGETAITWVESITADLRTYSTLNIAERPAVMQNIQELLQQPPGTTAIPNVAAVPSKPLASSKTSAPTTAELYEEVPKPAPPATLPGRGLDASVATLPGIGKRRAELLENLAVRTVQSFLHFYPRRYEDYSTLKTISRLEYGERTSLLATVWEAGGRKTRTGRYLFRAILSDNTGTLEVTWFNQRYLEGKIKTGMQILVSGKVDEYLGRLVMNSPEWELVERKNITNARIQPIYSLTEGIRQRWMRQTMQHALSAWAKRVPDTLPTALRKQYNLLPLERALWGIHLPDNLEHLKSAKRRLAFEEALYLQIGLLRQKLLWKSVPGREIETSSGERKALIATLPYALTNAQQRSLDEMIRDITSGQPMNRLLQGDVGSGKTVVAALLLGLTALHGLQAALMAPTEILAEQHYKGLSKLFANFPAPQPQLGLLTGSTPKAERETIYKALAEGSLQVVVGTHALIQDAVSFKELALVVIDEQHRFGVEQRGALRQKGYNPHLLVMTATPIPRSLELTVWGHLDVSVLDEMPPGRQPITTRLLFPRERERAYTFIRSQVAEGRQAFIIYPLVEASDKIEAKAAVDEHTRLQKEIFPDLRLGLLHGRLRAADKEKVMTAFAHGELDILIATSVVEVGIDVPNATVMLIDGAERFGLAQLHQFRGRVGRGQHQSYCLLLASNTAAESSERLKIVEATIDGFVLAQKDLEMRGPGQFLGTQQSGIPELPMAILADTRLLHEVRAAAQALLDIDPELTAPEHAALAARITEFWDTEGDLS